MSARSAACPSLALLFLTVLPEVGAQSVFINEIHYNNASTDVDEGVELAGPAGTDLADYGILLYNGAGGVTYGTPPALSGTIPNQSNGFGTKFFAIAAMQNGPDGIALKNKSTGEIIEFLSYGGSFTATNGAAKDLTSVNIGVVETDSTPVGYSLRRTGVGTVGADFQWQAPAVASRNGINSGQIFSTVPLAETRLSFSTSYLPEDAGADAVQGTLQIVPPPDGEITVTLHASEADELILPPSVTVNSSGVASFSVGINDDNVPDPDAVVEVSTSAPGTIPGSANLTVINIHMLGRVIISEYAEPDTDELPKGIEIFNRGSEPLNLAMTPLTVQQFTNGSAFGTVEATVSSGSVPPFGVVTIGNADLAVWMVTNGKLPDPGVPLTSFASGEQIKRADGTVAFVFKNFTYNGDDALRLYLGGIASDTLGVPGTDPGTRWASTSGPGSIFDPPVAYTANQVIRRAVAGIGNRETPLISEWVVGDKATYTGFGVRPPFADPFTEWTAANLLVNASVTSDSDGDGWLDLEEFGFGSDPRMPDSAAPPVQLVRDPVNLATLASLKVRRRLATPTLRQRVQYSENCVNWYDLDAPITTVPDGPNAEWNVFSAPPAEGPVRPQVFYRVMTTLLPQ